MNDDEPLGAERNGAVRGSRASSPPVDSGAYLGAVPSVDDSPLQGDVTPHAQPSRDNEGDPEGASPPPSIGCPSDPDEEFRTPEVSIL